MIDGIKNIGSVIDVDLNKSTVVKKLELNVEKESLIKNDSTTDNKQDSENKVSDFSNIVKNISSVVNNDNIALQFSKDEDTEKLILKVIDSETKEVIHQYPADVSLQIAKIVSENLEPGIITNAKV